jgi:glutathione S-transferase
MARGWESKAVEDQQQEALADRSPAASTPEDPQRQAARASILLARSRALADLQLACAPAHRAMLEQAIRDLDERLAGLG